LLNIPIGSIGDSLMGIDNYLNLIQAYVDGSITTRAFEFAYMDIFLSETQFFGPEIFSILDGLFSDVDSYDPHCLPSEETHFRISEATLRLQAKKSLDALGSYTKYQSEK
jgi:hypothetical protein